ncbi:MAG: hypothetical protein NZ108_04960 [Bacteroidia bacterium]|nr:hypothetical protein [Bacteroidia bacterium]
MNDNMNIERLRFLKQKGEKLFVEGKVKYELFFVWRVQVYNYLKSILPNSNPYLTLFEDTVFKASGNAFDFYVKSGVSILEAIIEDYLFESAKSSESESPETSEGSYTIEINSDSEIN